MTEPLTARRRKATRALILGGLIALAAALGYAHTGGHAATTDRSSGAVRPPVAEPVGIATAIRGTIDVVLKAIGTVTPLATVTVKTQINGQLQRVGFTEGQIVHKGDFLAQIDPRPYRAALEEYEGQLGRDEALLKQAKADLARYQILFRQDSIARQQAEDQTFLVQQYQAAVRSDHGLVDMQKLNITYCYIVSPITGRVGLRQVDPGNYVQTTDSSGLVVVTQLQPISVVFALPEDDLTRVLDRLHHGVRLPVTVFDRADITALATGTLATIDNKVDTTTGTWKLRALFDNAGEGLFPDQFVNVRLVVGTHRGAITVPNAAIQNGAPGTYVYRVRPDDTVTVQVVRTGAADGNRVEVLSGLAAGDRVVVDGTDRLHDGALISVQAAMAAP